MGVPPEEIARLRREASAAPESRFGVDAEIWQSYLVFDALATQWIIIAGFGGAYYQGINYDALRSVEKHLGVKKSKRKQIFNDLRVMEAEAKTILNEPRE